MSIHALLSAIEARPRIMGQQAPILVGLLAYAEEAEGGRLLLHNPTRIEEIKGWMPGACWEALMQASRVGLIQAARWQPKERVVSFAPA